MARTRSEQERAAHVEYMRRRRQDPAYRAEQAAKERERYRAKVATGWKPTRSTPARRPTSKKTPLPPLPEIATGHPLFAEARSHLRGWEASDFSRDMDTMAADLISEYVVATLEGGDGLAAMAAFRRRYNHDRKALVFGLALVDGLER